MKYYRRVGKKGRELHKLSLLHENDLQGVFPAIPCNFQQLRHTFLDFRSIKVAIYVKQRATLSRKYWPSSLTDLVFPLTPKKRRKAKTSEGK